MNSRDVSTLDRHLGYWLRFVSNHVSFAFRRKVEAKGVTVAEWAVMRQMLDLGPVQPSFLADELGMTRGAISKLVERLRVKELAERTAAGGDGRCQRVELTTKGKRLVPALARLADDNDAEFFGHLSAKQQTELARLLQDIVQRQGWKDIPVA
jgi:DNA-binding MarR family transcriptional regulator